MHVEKKVQDKIIKTAKRCGFYVIKTRPGPGTPKGMLDVLLLKEGFWGAVECKAYPDSEWQTLQEYTYNKFADWSWARIAHSENVDDVCAEIEALA